jgi:hypothetical protein
VFLSIVLMLVLETRTLIEDHESDAGFCRDRGVPLPVYERERAMPHPTQRLAPRPGERSA